MATLVLSTVGTMLGGPVGGAIGSLLGQSIDQQLLGTGPRHGPRLGDLSVQTSSYGTAIPQIFGRMRVAGCIVWSTDLNESSETEGAKGQPESVTYSYSASFAVALSSRRISSVGRIWADGKLIRTADGEFTVATGFRVYDGSEDQPIDPLIASMESPSATPAYRGIALAVFENLELAEFGNRIPFLTFEVVADVDPVPIDTVLREASDGIIAASALPVVHGYAAHGASVGDAVEPLVRAFGLSLVDDGSRLSSPGAQVAIIDQAQIGCTAGHRQISLTERSQVAAARLPSALTLAYYDSGRDYQSGLARASLDNSHNRREALEIPAVLDSAAAKALAETSLARRWAERDKLMLRLPPAYLSISAGSTVRLAADSTLWMAEQVTLDSLTAVVELRASYGAVASVSADAGRVLPATAALALPTKILVVELPDDGTGDASSPVVVVAATGSSPWRAVPILVECGGTTCTIRSADAAALMGSAVTQLEAGEASLFDLRNSIDVQLARADDWLLSCDDAGLVAGENLAIIGSEIFQFGDAFPLGDGRFRLSRLLRGRRGTEWAMALHQPGEPFLLLDPSRLRRLPMSSAQTGARVRVTPGGLRDNETSGVDHLVTGEALRPPSPVHLRASLDQQGRLTCSWIRRSRQGWDWLDGVDAPLGSVAENYRVTLRGEHGAIIRESSAAAAEFTATEMSQVGIAGLELSVVQVGDFGVSRPSALPITLNS